MKNPYTGDDRTRMAASDIHGSGTQATNFIAEGSLIRHLSGDIVNFREILNRIKAGKLSPDDPLQIAEDLFIDLDAPSHAINHSCHPNAGIRGRTELVALRDISPGEEICYDYSATVSKSIDAKGWTMHCCCGADNCRGQLGNVLTIPKEQLQTYFKANSLQSYILEELRDVLPPASRDNSLH